MRPKYQLCPGVVVSATDGQEHYIGAMTLARLYGVDLRECVIYEPAPWWTRSFFEYEDALCGGLIRLKPRRDGNYTIHNH